MLVENLNDGGPGSFRACAEATGPRICIFRAGGTITVNSTIEITSPFLTIAGQSAPGGGIAIRSSNDNIESTILIETHDVIVRYLRVRPGLSTAPAENQRALSMFNRPPNSEDESVYNIIIDHSSFSWSSDELISSWYDAHDITLQWNIFSEAFACANHIKSNQDGDDICEVGDSSGSETEYHSKGPLIGRTGSTNYSIHHNLFAHNSDRNPQISSDGISDVVNNVVYNPFFTPVAADDKGAPSDYPALPRGPVRMNFVGNYLRLGPDSRSEYFLSLRSSDGGDQGHSIFVAQNIGPTRASQTIAEVMVVKEHDIAGTWVAENRFSAPLITTHDCDADDDCELLAQILAGAGATLPVRDAVDKRIVNEVIHSRGQIRDTQKDFCEVPICRGNRVITPDDYRKAGAATPLDADGYPLLLRGDPYPDDDRDGMSDLWEMAHGLNPDQNDSALIDPGSGYTYIEVFLNELAAKSLVNPSIYVPVH